MAMLFVDRPKTSVRDFEILIHLNIFEEKKNQRVPPRSAPEYTEPEIVPYDDGWPEYDETIFDFLKTQRSSMESYAHMTEKSAEYGMVMVENRLKNKWKRGGKYW